MFREKHAAQGRVSRQSARHTLGILAGEGLPEPLLAGEGRPEPLLAGEERPEPLLAGTEGEGRLTRGRSNNTGDESCDKSKFHVVN